MSFVIIIIMEYIHATGPTKSKFFEEKIPAAVVSTNAGDCQSSFVGFHLELIWFEAQSAPNQLLCLFHSLPFQRFALQAIDLYQSAANRSSAHLKLIKNRSACGSGSDGRSRTINLRGTIQRKYWLDVPRLPGCRWINFKVFRIKFPCIEMRKAKRRDNHVKGIPYTLSSFFLWCSVAASTPNNYPNQKVFSHWIDGTMKLIKVWSIVCGKTTSSALNWSVNRHGDWQADTGNHTEAYLDCDCSFVLWLNKNSSTLNRHTPYTSAFVLDCS